MKVLLSVWLLLASGVLAGELGSLRDSHPRLLITSHDVWQQLQARGERDAKLKTMLDTIVADAKMILDEPPLAREQIGRRILRTSRSLLWRVVRLSTAFHLTGDRQYARRAIAEMTQVAAFSDWNPNHFLDVAEMTTGLALGYDWLYESLTETERELIATTIRDQGLKPAMANERWNWWHKGDNNWNQVCFGGMVLGTLAIADREPVLAEQFLQVAKSNIGNGLATYAPDGVYPEGPNYWHYGTAYSVLMIEGLRSALGTDWQVPQSPGFLASGAAYVQLCSPSGVTYNFSDGSPSAAFRPALFWFARETSNPGLLAKQRDLVPSEAQLGQSRFAPMAALWWPQAGLGQDPKQPLLWSGQGPSPVAVFREAWGDPQALYLACKGGRATVSHGHMDAGSFILEADGVRWAIELKQQDYHDLESKGVNLWGKEQDAMRWQIFRLGPFAHNTLTIDRNLHQADGFAPLTTTPDGRTALVDLRNPLGGDVRTALRTFTWLPERTVLIKDEVTGLTPGMRVRWAMMTRARIELQGNRAILHQDGKKLYAAVDDGLTFASLPADPPDDGLSAPNPGVSILAVYGTPDRFGNLDVAVKLRPGKPVQPGRRRK